MAEVFSHKIKLQDLLDHALTIALGVVNAANGSILLADPDQQELIVDNSDRTRANGDH
jgi:hypothetical protein